MTIELSEVIASHGDDDPSRYIAIADHFLRLEDRPAAAVALDRAYGLIPNDTDLARHRAAILDELAIQEHGLVWRYVPAGTFAMGSRDGDPDERPVHHRTLAAFWITDVPITWAAYCTLRGWTPSQMHDPELAKLDRSTQFAIRQSEKMRRTYCESQDYATKPMCAVTLFEADALCAGLATSAVRYALPTEAQWEKAARGGLVGARYSWGDAAPTPALCDFDRMGDYRLLDPRALPANGYGLHGMCGGLSEWTADGYDALAYGRAAGIASDANQRVLRGGSWTDCASAVTVSRRMARAGDRPPSPTIGMRLVRNLLAMT
ncbi:MAG: SUMF1/EgtB/PvdO family nonheme iron enzyme [Kofleriaceae bacterium]